MIAILEENPLLLLFIVVAIGYWIGRIPIRGSTVGVAAVLFVGLAFGALDPALSIPLIVLELGLVLFVFLVSFLVVFAGMYVSPSLCSFYLFSEDILHSFY